MRGRDLDPMRVDPTQLSEADLRTCFFVLRERFSNLDADYQRLKKRPVGKTVSRMIFAIVGGILMLFAGLLYTYAINKLTATSPDLAAGTLLNYAVWIYIIGMAVQIINAGVNQ